MRRFYVLGFLLLLISKADAQKKNFTFEQLFRNVETNALKPLPVIKGWVDDTHYIVVQKDANGTSTTLLTDVKTGKGNGPLNHFFNPEKLIKHEVVG